MGNMARSCFSDPAEAGQSGDVSSEGTRGVVRSLTDGERLTLEELYRAHFSRVMRVCLGILRHPDDADEAAQEVFTRAASMIGRMSDPAAVLVTIARNHCRDALRRDHRRPTTELQRVALISTDEDVEAQAVNRHLIRFVLARLNGRQRRALILHAIGERSLGEIAADLKVSYPAAKQTVYRARLQASLLARDESECHLPLAMGARRDGDPECLSGRRGQLWPVWGLA